MGFHIYIVGYLFGIPVLLLWEAAPNSGSLCPLPYTASREACQRCCKQSLIITLLITLAESVSFRRGELAVKLGLWKSQVPISRNFKFNGYKKVAAGIGSKGRSHDSPSTSPSIKR